MKKLTEKRAAELKAKGITHIASIVKSHYDSEYFKVETIEAILENGGRMPKYARNIFGYVEGVNGNQIDWSKTIRWCKI
jgi:hypothetical protein